MKRDMDLCREILRSLEESEERVVELAVIVEAVGRPKKECYHHCHILAEAGLLHERYEEQTQKIPNLNYRARPGEFDPSKATYTVHAGTWIAYSLTWQGHEFLDESRNTAHWEKAKSVAQVSGTWSFSVISDILKNIVTEAWTKQFS